MKIYVDAYYIDFLTPNTFVQFDNIDTIPDHVDIIGITRYDKNLEQHQLIINQLLPKTKKLIVTLIEAVNPNLIDFLLANADPRLTFMVDSDLNHWVPNAKTITSWFMCPTMFYRTAPQARDLLDKLVFDINKPKLFDCLLGQQRDHRDQVEQFYHRSPHKDQFIFTYFKDNIRNGHWNLDIGSIQKTGMQIDYQGWKAPLSSLIPVEIYNQSHYSIVTETIAFNTHNQYTEKLAKPMLAKRLFVVFAGQYYLRNLRCKGFMTFDGIIDESYDLIEDPTERFTQAWRQVEWLCQQDPVQIITNLEHIVNHNQQHLLNTDWHENMRSLLINLGSESK